MSLTLAVHMSCVHGKEKKLYCNVHPFIMKREGYQSCHIPGNYPERPGNHSGLQGTLVLYQHVQKYALIRWTQDD